MRKFTAVLTFPLSAGRWPSTTDRWQICIFDISLLSIKYYIESLKIAIKVKTSLQSQSYGLIITYRAYANYMNGQINMICCKLQVQKMRRCSRICEVLHVPMKKLAEDNCTQTSFNAVHSRHSFTSFFFYLFLKRL